MPYDLFGDYEVSDYGTDTDEKPYDIFGGYEVTSPEPPPRSIDTLTPPTQTDVATGSLFNRTEVAGNAIGSGIAQGLYGIASAWNTWTNDPEEALLYSQLAGNIDNLAQQEEAGYVENTVRGITRSLTMALPAIGAGIAGAAAAPAIGVGALGAGIAAGTAAGLSINVPATYVDTLRETDDPIQARNAAAIEGVITSIFSAVPGMAGMQGVAPTILKGVGRETVKQVGKRVGWELAEEELIQVGQNVNRMYHAFNPERGTVEQLFDGTVDVAVQTLGTMGLLEGGARGIRAYQEGSQQPEIAQPTTQPAEPVATEVTPPTSFAKADFMQQSAVDTFYNQNPERAETFLKSNASRKDFAALTGLEDSPKSPIAEYKAEDRVQLQSMLELSRTTGDKETQKSDRIAARHARMLRTGIPADDPMFRAIEALDFDKPKAADAPQALKDIGINKLYGLDPTSSTMMTEDMTGKQVRALSNSRLKTLFRIKDGTAHGAAVEYDVNDNAVFMNKGTLTDQDFYNRVLTHEAGHVLANVQVDDQSLMSAMFDIQGTLPDLEKQLELLTQADKAATARLGYTVDEAQQGLFDDGNAVPTQKEQEYLDLRDELFYDFKEKATRLKVRFSEGEFDEALKVSLLGRPFDPKRASPAQLKDRYSVHEVYADAMTMLFTAPEVMQTHAPKLWARFTESIQHKKQFLGKYLEIQAALNGEPHEIATLQAKFLKDRIKDPGDALRVHNQQRMKQKDDYNYRWQESILKAMVDKTYPATAHMDDLERAAYVKAGLEQFGHAAFRVVNAFKPIDDQIQQLGMDSADVSQVMVGEVVKARSQMEGKQEVYTGGSTEETFQRIETELIKKYGNAPVAKLKTLIQERNEKTILPALRELNRIGEISDEAMAALEASSAWYSPLLSMYHLQETGYVSSKLAEMTGDLGDKVEPHVAALLKAISVAEYASQRAAQHEATNTKIVALDLEVVNSVEKPKKPPGYGKTWIHEYVPNEKGTLTKQWVLMDKTHAEAIYGTPQRAMNLNVAKANNMMYRVFYPLLLTFRAAYMPRQFAKDIFRTLKTAPAVMAGQTEAKFSGLQFLKNLPSAGKLAKEAIFGKGDLPDKVKELIASGHIDPIVSDYVTKLHLLAEEDIDKQDVITETMERAGYRLNDPQHREAVNAKLGKLAKAERFMNRLANFQNMTVKIAGAMEVQRAFDGKSPHTAAWVTQNFVGTPNLNQRADLSQEVNLLSFFSRVALTGVQADLVAMKNSKSAAEYGKNWMKYAAVPKLFKYAALYGLLGETWKQMWESIPEYERDKQNAIPVGLYVDTDGQTKALYLSLFPSDPVGAVFDSMLDQFVRFWAEGKGQGNKEGIMDEFGKVMEAVNQAQPLTSFNTPLQIYSTWAQFMRNENPRDPFFGNEIVTEEHRRQGLWASTLPMVRWTASKFGAPSEYLSGPLDAILGPLYPSVTETPKTKNVLGFVPVPVTAQGWLQAIPGVGQMLKLGNRGIQEDIYELNSMMRAEEMWARDRMDKTTKDLTVLKERLANEMVMGKLSPERIKKLAIYSVWHSEAYIPLREQAMQAHADGDDQEANRILGILKQRSEQVRDGVTLPDFAISSVLWKITDTPEDQRVAQKNLKVGQVFKAEVNEKKLSQENTLKALLVARQMPHETLMMHLRSAYIQKMQPETVAKVSNQMGIPNVGRTPDAVKEDILKSAYAPPLFEKSRKPTAYGKRVFRLEELIGQ